MASPRGKGGPVVPTQWTGETDARARGLLGVPLHLEVHFLNEF